MGCTRRFCVFKLVPWLMLSIKADKTTQVSCSNCLYIVKTWPMALVYNKKIALENNDVSIFSGCNNFLLRTEIQSGYIHHMNGYQLRHNTPNLTGVSLFVLSLSKTCRGFYLKPNNLEAHLHYLLVKTLFIA